MEKFIGDKKIIKEKENGKMVEITLEDKSTFELNSELLEKIKTKEKGQGTILDNINNYFARKFLAELAYYELDYYFAANVGQAMNVLAHNLRENLLKTTFKCSGGDSIPLKKLYDEKM